MRKWIFAYVKRKAQISYAVTEKLINGFVFTTRIVQFLFFLNQKFQASSPLLCLYGSVCVGPVRKPYCRFSHDAAHMINLIMGSKRTTKECKLFYVINFANKTMQQHNCGNTELKLTGTS